MRLLHVLTALTTGAALTALAAPPATGAPPPPDPLVGGLVGPLQLDVTASGRILVAQSFAGVLSEVRADGTSRTVLTQQGSINGVAARRGRIAFLYSTTTPGDPGAGKLKVRARDGAIRTVANLAAFEREQNPDSGRSYGFRGLSAECAAQLPDEFIGAEPYPGAVDSNPYALANAPDGGWYVADAGGNDVLHVSRRGAVKVVHVARAQRLVVTAEAAAAVDLPDCVVGKTYAFEGVPTDVEVSATGRLFVSLLPGGPESPALGARGKVVRVDPRTGKTKAVASGLLAATNVALAPRGRLFVTELFAGRVTRVDLRTGRTRTTLEAPLPAAVEYADGRLVVSINALPAPDTAPDGQIVVLRR